MLKKELEKDFENAIKNSEFKIFLQPKFDIKTEKIVAYRWRRSCCEAQKYPWYFLLSVWVFPKIIS